MRDGGPAGGYPPAEKTGADIARVLLSADEIRDKVAELGARISRDYSGRDLLLLSVLKGSVVFMADLMRAISIPVSIDFMAVSSYGSGTKSSGVVQILKDVQVELAGKHLLLVEDILDSGMTLSYLKEMLEVRDPASIGVVTLLDKPARRRVDIEADYRGFVVPDEFIVGYGLDYDEHYRNLPYIGVLRTDIYEPED